MARTTLRQYRETCDPFHVGDTAMDQLVLGYPMTLGEFFPFLSGAVLLLRRRLYPAPKPWRYCGWARTSEATISNLNGFDHEASMGFQYVAVRAFGNGYISPACEPVRVDFDGAGDLIDPALPMPPVNVVAQPVLDGAFDVHWQYDPWGQGGFPTDFQVFGGATVATIDFGTALGTVLYVADRDYTFTTETFSDGAPKSFAVRARNSSGTAELNIVGTAVLKAIATPPTGATIQTADMRPHKRRDLRGE